MKKISRSKKFLKKLREQNPDYATTGRSPEDQKRNNDFLLEVKKDLHLKSIRSSISASQVILNR